jgi:L-histidine Nalpha-methyltransferase
LRPRLRASAGRAQAEFARDVARGLGSRPRRIPPRYFYDALGSQLFEAICRLPWYPLTRAEDALLLRHAGRVLDALPGPLEILELGCGSGEKAAHLVGALLQRQRRATVHLVDVSARALDVSEATLRARGAVRVVRHQARYEEGLRVAASRRGGRTGLLVLFLGSNVGNFEPAEALAFLRGLRAHLRPRDALLLGTDLVKPARTLRLAYDDPLGVTAAFNLNLLRRMNDELGANFALEAFSHRARWNAKAARMEMYLVSRRAQSVRIPAARLRLRFAAGDTLWTESSHKFTRAGVAALARAAAFEVRLSLEDARAGFLESLLGPVQA